MMVAPSPFRRFLKEWWWPLAAVALLIADQAVKALVIAAEPDLDLGLARIVLVYNKGSAFSIFQDANLLLAWIAIIVLGLFVAFAKHTPKKSMPWAVIAAGGVVGNLIDRVLRGAVVDFIDMGWWPVFNIADAMIVVGVLVVAAQLLADERRAKRKKK